MKTDEIKWRILNDTAENVVAWIEGKDRRIARLEAILELWCEYYTDGLQSDDVQNLYIDSLALMEKCDE